MIKELNRIESKRVMEWQQINYYPLMSRLLQNHNYDKSFVMKSAPDQGEFYFIFH